jgi:hypothetical protein
MSKTKEHYHDQIETEQRGQLVLFKNKVMQLLDFTKQTDPADIKKAYGGNKAATVRIRKQLLYIEKQAKAARVEILELRKNLKYTK